MGEVHVDQCFVQLFATNMVIKKATVNDDYTSPTASAVISVVRAQ